MGVMPCNRTGCDRILCDRYSSEYGYICGTCFNEMVDSNIVDIAAFMGIAPENTEKLTIDYYNSIFPDRSDEDYRGP